MELPIAEIRTDKRLSKKIEISILTVGAVVSLSLFLILPPLYALAGSLAYFITIVYGFYVLRALDLYVAIYREKILVVQGFRRYLVRYEDIENIIIEPKIVSISIQPIALPEKLSSATSSITRRVRLPSIVSGTYIVRIRLRSSTEIVFQIFKDEYEILVRALRKARQLGAKLPEVVAY